MVQILWGIVNKANVDYADLIWEDFMYQIKNDKVLAKLKFVTKGESTGKPRYGKAIPDVILSDDIKASADYVNYLTKVSCVSQSGRTWEKRRGTLNKSQTVLNREVNKEVDEGFKEQMKLKFKAVEQITPDAQLLLDLKKGSRASIEAHILKQIPKDPGEGSSKVPDTPDHNNQAGSFRIHVHDKEQEQCIIQPHSPSVTISSHEDVSRYLNENPENVQDDISAADLTSSPPATTTHAPVTKSQQKRAKQLLKKARQTKNDSTKAIMQNLADHEQMINALAQVDHDEVIEESVKANILNEVKNQLLKFVPIAVSDFVEPHLKRTILDLKHKLYEMMFQSASYLTHDKERALYDALQESMQIDELQARYELAQPSRKKRSHDDQDPPKNCEGENQKRRRKGAGESSLKKDKAPADSSNFERFADEPQQQEQDIPTEAFKGNHPNWFKKPNEKKIEELLSKAGLMNSFLKKDEITKAYLEGPAFELLKNRFENNVELEYNLEQFYLAMMDKIDWTNLEGDRFHTDLNRQWFYKGSIGRPSADDVYSKIMIISVQRIMKNRDQEESRRCTARSGKLPNQAQLDKTTVRLKRSLLQAVVYHLMLNKVYRKLDMMLKDNVLGFGNEGLEDHAWKMKDRERTDSMQNKIEKTLKERQMMRMLELFF
ncbi:hypothetical protein Tco_0522194 [Tanacetum coccineum]